LRSVSAAHRKRGTDAASAATATNAYLPALPSPTASIVTTSASGLPVGQWIEIAGGSRIATRTRAT
jgi:hypothetical protein